MRRDSSSEGATSRQQLPIEVAYWPHGQRHQGSPDVLTPFFRCLKQNLIPPLWSLTVCTLPDWMQWQNEGWTENVKGKMSKGGSGITQNERDNGDNNIIHF